MEVTWCLLSMLVVAFIVAIITKSQLALIIGVIVLTVLFCWLIID